MTFDEFFLNFFQQFQEGSGTKIPSKVILILDFTILIILFFQNFDNMPFEIVYKLQYFNV